MYFFIAVLFLGPFLYFFIQYRNNKKQEKKEKQEHFNHKVHFKVLMDDGTIENHTMSRGKAQEKFPVMMPNGFRKDFTREPFATLQKK